jgi:transposase
MAQPKLQKAETDSFYGDYLYANIVPENHFLRLLRDLVPWQRFTYRLIKFYRGKGQVGRPPIDPAILLKMLLLSYLYDLSERQVEEFCNYFLPAKYFLGLAIDAHAPDHSTLRPLRKLGQTDNRAPLGRKFTSYGVLQGPGRWSIGSSRPVFGPRDARGTR